MLEPIEDLTIQVVDIQNYCQHCNYSCTRNSDLKKHLSTKKHVKNVGVPYPRRQLDCKHQCKACDKQFQSQQSLWYHKKKCVQPKPIVAQSTIFELRNDIKGLAKIITDLVKNNNK